MLLTDAERKPYSCRFREYLEVGEEVGEGRQFEEPLLDLLKRSAKGLRGAWICVAEGERAGIFQ